jgi:predicted ArsR family transcriptional regulator
MAETTLARTFSSEVRWKILDLLMAKELTESQIGRALGIGVRTVKANIIELVYSRLVEAQHKKLPSGRNEVVYRVTSSAKTLGFPPRSYDYLSEALINGLVSSLGEKSARVVLRDIGFKLGEEMGRSLLADTNSTKLTMKEYGQLVVANLLAAKRTYPQILSQKNSEIVYEQFNCPFQELADKIPGLLCDVLDSAVHDGLDRALGVSTTRYTCKGHGDSACRFRVVPSG